MKRFLFAALLAAALHTPAHADDTLARVNDRFGDVGTPRRSDLAVVPAWIKMQPTPDAATAVSDGQRAEFLTWDPADPRWAQLDAWVTAEPQKAVLAALDRVTKERDWHTAPAFAQPYGVQGVPVEFIRAGFYTELGDPPTLAQAKRGKLLQALLATHTLALAESFRLERAGEPAAALKVMTDAVLFTRQFADRRFRVEVSTAMAMMSDGLLRIRDIAYTDFRGSKKIDIPSIATVLQRLDENGPLGVERIRWPDGDRLAAEQIIERTYQPDGSINAELFAGTMSRAGSSDLPLRLFSESAKWREVGSAQAARTDMQAQLARVFGDWESRWTLDPFDPRLALAYEFPRTDPNRFAIVTRILGDMSSLFDLRRTLRAEAVGTRTSLAMYGYWLSAKAFPPDVSAVAPRFLKAVEPDPFNPNRQRGAQPPMHFFVPVRDTQNQGGGDIYSVTVAAGGLTFDARLGQDQFVLVSVGGDGQRNWARRVENLPTPVPSADYLIWPPVSSLVRKHLGDTR